MHDRLARLWEVARAFLQIGALGYGGPAIVMRNIGAIPLMIAGAALGIVLPLVI